MPNLTLVITDDLKHEMDKHPMIKWSNAVRSIIKQKLEEFEEAERIAKKSKLAWKHWKPIEREIARNAAKHAKALLDEADN